MQVDSSNSPGETPSPDGGLDGRIRVMVVDDHAAVRAGVRRLLAAEPDMLVVSEAADTTEAIHGAAGVDVAVVDYHLGDRDGLWLTGFLRRLDPAPRVLIYSAFSDEALAVAAMIAGADGLLSKSAIGEELCLAVRRIAAGRRYLPHVSMPVADAMRAQVTGRLQPVIGMLVQGISAAQVLEALQISPEELDEARAAILSALAPTATRGHVPSTSLATMDYERPRNGGYA